MKAAGERVWLHYDPAPGQAIEEGDYIRTGTGRTYLISMVRVQTRGVHSGRFHLVATVMPADHITEPDATVHTIVWYPR